MSDVSIRNANTVAYLEKNYLLKSNPEMAKDLGVTVGVVTGLIQRLGLKRPSRLVMVKPISGEIWKDVSSHPGYRVSNLGRIANGKVLLTQTINGRGYLQVKMYNIAGERKSERVHRIVAAAFVPNPLQKREVNHKDGDKHNNAASNLEWCTGRENVCHAVKNGLVKRRSGAAHHMCRYDEQTIHTVCKMLKEGKRPPYIEKTLGIRQGYVSKIASKEVWRVISDTYF